MVHRLVVRPATQNDDMAARLMTRIALEEGGFKVLEAEDGIPALELFRTMGATFSWKHEVVTADPASVTAAKASAPQEDAA